MLSGFIISPNWPEVFYFYSQFSGQTRAYSFKKSHSQIYKQDVQMEKGVIYQINTFEF